MLQNITMRQLGLGSHDAPLYEPLHHMISPWNLCIIISMHKPTQHLGPTLSHSLYNPKNPTFEHMAHHLGPTFSHSLCNPKNPTFEHMPHHRISYI
jgi:hypothetical protein